MSALVIDDELVDEEDTSSDRGVSVYESHANHQCDQESNQEDDNSGNLSNRDSRMGQCSQ